ncbi:uncharacterized protein VTP21DRAFT_8126 [Calcarisporiella thermophila]|uniref:uncharacterized protein n=1 Tax=Calcarisporiella thermophila TaxID=911321 RepID=UPI00374452E4
MSKLHMTVGSLIAQARQSLADVFDIPSPQIVLAFLNMDTCLQYVSHYKDAYTFYPQAVQMAFSLRMYKDDATEKDPVQIEFRRRIWADICVRELNYVFERNKPLLISMNIIKSSPKPTVTARDSESYKIATIYFLLKITTFSRLLKLQDIDWTLPDVIIVQKLAGLTAYLQHEYTEEIQYCSKGNLLNLFPLVLNFNFWSYWCSLWRQFIKSDAPAGRLETNMMRQLREKAFDEYVKGLIHCISFFKWVMNSQVRCKYKVLLGASIVCDNVKFIARMHPKVRIRLKIFQELIKILNILQSPEIKGILAQLLTRQFMDILDEIKPAIFSREVLEHIA